MNILFLHKRWQATGLVLLVLSLAGCATQLAPPYDQVVADGITQINTEVMSVFATVSSGTTADTFKSREEKYNSVIGKLDALVIQAGARPVPRNRTTEAINKLLQSRGAEPVMDDDGSPPSATALKKVSETITKMRDTDKKQGVTATEVLAFKGQASIALDQATTYENFLQR